MITRRARIQRTAPVRKRRAPHKHQRTAEKDQVFLRWMHVHPCLVAGRRDDSPCSGVITVHHLRHITFPDGTMERTGRIDRRTLTLCQGHHQTGPHAVHVMTGDQGRDWEWFFDVYSEREVERYNALFDGVEPVCECRLVGDHADARGCELHSVSRNQLPGLVMEDGDVCPF